MDMHRPKVKDGVEGYREYIFLAERQPQSTDSGTFTSGDWRTRALNTIVVDETGLVTLSSDQFTLPAGTYEITAGAPAFKCGTHQARLQNITDATTTIQGLSEHANAVDNPNVRAGVLGKFIIAASKTFQLQHQCQTTSNTVGLGIDSNFGEETFSTVQLWRIR